MSSPLTFLHASVRWLDFVGLTTLLGGLAFRLLVVRPTLLSCEEFDSFERRSRMVEAVSIVLLVLTTIGDLILRTLTMSGPAAGLGGALPLVLRKTHYGSVWISRMVLVVFLATAWLLRRPGPSRSAWSTWGSLLGAALIALTTTLSGHAADWGDVTLPVLMDWLHLLAISNWTGGLFSLGFVLHHSLLPPVKEEMQHRLASIVMRFSRMAAYCAAGFFATGFYNAWIQVTSLSPLFTTPYGWTLLAKLSLVLLIVTMAALNRYYFLSLLGGRSGAPDRLIVRVIGRFTGTLLAEKVGKDGEKIRQQFFLSVRLEWLVAVGALACTALLTQLPPARHIRSHQHREEHALHQPTQGPVTAKRVAGGEGVLREMNSSLFLGKPQ
jgi:putative copper export protein